MSTFFESLEKENEDLTQLLCKVSIIKVGQNLKAEDVSHHVLSFVHHGMFAGVTILSFLLSRAAANMIARLSLLFSRN